MTSLFFNFDWQDQSSGAATASSSFGW